MDRLYENSERKIRYIDTSWKRYIYNQIDWNDRLIVITGSRGTGKTTLILQSLRERREINSIYLSIDDIFFTENSLLETIDHFYKAGVTHFYLDEVHKYPTWAIEVKNAYDQFPDIHIVVTGSSTLNIIERGVDLSRRVSSYKMAGLSFREYLSFENILSIEPFTLLNLLQDHQNISSTILDKIKPLKHFPDYLEYGYYPFYSENRTNYHERIRNTINIILEYDLLSILRIDYINIYKLKKLLKILSYSVPFKPNISELAKKLELNRSYIYRFLDVLEKAGLIGLLYYADTGMNQLNKPEKIYLNNSNLLYAITQNPKVGNIRETFFYNQLQIGNQISYSGNGDFLVNDMFIFEIGGKSKEKNLTDNSIDENYYLVKDSIEIGFKSTIPLWMFGFLY